MLSIVRTLTPLTVHLVLMYPFNFKGPLKGGGGGTHMYIVYQDFGAL